ncbi:hypothetical protein EFR84_08830 [Rhizobium chutanense]|uniref:Uncharacterized protein n=1 Tax=Rhizobium chutanense TaxID=2035448 RepID=A0A432P540_9HYPH|nr:hypothetical protein EFR84_08830 [Rhizobium chutanense]
MMPKVKRLRSPAACFLDRELSSIENAGILNRSSLRSAVSGGFALPGRNEKSRRKGGIFVIR